MESPPAFKITNDQEKPYTLFFFFFFWIMNIFTFMPSNYQKSQTCKESTSKHEVRKEVQVEFEMLNYF